MYFISALFTIWSPPSLCRKKESANAVARFFKLVSEYITTPLWETPSDSQQGQQMAPKDTHSALLLRVFSLEKACILSRVKQITGPGWMHETSARTWCSGRTWRERVGREVGGGIGMGKTCEPKAFSFQCMTKFTTNKIIIIIIIIKLK